MFDLDWFNVGSRVHKISGFNIWLWNCFRRKNEDFDNWGFGFIQIGDRHLFYIGWDRISVLFAVVEYYKIVALVNRFRWFSRSLKYWITGDIRFFPSLSSLHVEPWIETPWDKNLQWISVLAEKHKLEKQLGIFGWSRELDDMSIEDVLPRISNSGSIVDRQYVSRALVSAEELNRNLADSLLIDFVPKPLTIELKDRNTAKPQNNDK
jgi:hypothetical protein